MFDTYIVKEGDTIFMEYCQKNIKLNDIILLGREKYQEIIVNRLFYESSA